MILVMAGTRDARAFSSIVQLARQLAAKGLQVAIDERSAPDPMEAAQKFEAIGLMGQIDADQIGHVLIIGARTVGDEVLQDLHGFGLNARVTVTAIDHFDTPQGIITSQSKLAYVLGFEPRLVNLNELFSTTFLESALAPLVHCGLTAEQSANSPRVLIYMPRKLLSETHWLAHLDMLASSPELTVQVITEARGKVRVRQSQFSSLSTYSLSELLPETMAQLADILVFFGENIPGERMASLALEMFGKGDAIVDCTQRGAFVATGAPAIRGPLDIAGLGGFLQSAVVPNLDGIRSETAANRWVQQRSVDKLIAATGLKAPPRKIRKAAGRVLFVPTNGVGLGHAQRCGQIATAMGAKSRVGFAAFPSCVPMLQDKGFDCLALVQKSDQHGDSFANNLLNYHRLKTAVQGDDHMVFDGGYVFDSIYRTILEKRLLATWIRRGLWQAGQSNQTPLERERAFDQVIIPQECFDELNTDYSFGAHIHKVGPIVQRSALTDAEKATCRENLKNQTGVNFDRLIVSMLGGGVAADRSTQLQVLAAQLSGRSDCLHLVVVWPNARISPNLFGWNNTIVVRTHRALNLCQISDFVVSASGYNSFHELLYHRVPTIFIPQMSGSTDDQDRRALAASERGLAATVQAEELLSLKRQVNDFLDGTGAEKIAAALAREILLETGNVVAAQLIEGLRR